MSVRGRQSREMRSAVASFSQQRTTLAPYQIRTCARCGRHTTFVLEDAAGGWYSCIECGRYA
jgi:PHP family Zn ribbon phosphoesterase